MSDFNDSYYIYDYTDSNLMSREICQDILYVTLNIILGKSIIENDYLNTDNDINISVLRRILSHHYNTYARAYKCIYELRKYRSNYELTSKQLINIREDYENLRGFFEYTDETFNEYIKKV